MATSTISSTITTISQNDQRTSANDLTCPSAPVVHPSASSKSVSSLFERVTNFRRSLIKNQHKKNKTRPASGSFNFFKHSSSSSLLDSDKYDTSHCKTGSQSSSLLNCSVGGDMKSMAKENYPNTDPIISANDDINRTQLRNSIIVDEEDAIYGFTSLHFNNQTTSRRQLKPPSVSSSSSTSSSLSSSSSSSSSQLKSQIITSSSCISLYETIDEIEPPESSSPPNAVSSSIDRNSIFKQKFTKSNTSARGKYTKHHQQSSHTSVNNQQQQILFNGDDNWKRNRRSSAIIFGNDFHENLDPTIYGEGSKFDLNQHSNYHLLAFSNSQQQSQCRLRRSSDDLLIMSQSNTIRNFPERQLSDNTAMFNMNGNQQSRIYENLLVAKQPFDRTVPSINGKRCDNRKLTKDSGYESASTLVSLSQLNSGISPPVPSSKCVTQNNNGANCFVLTNNTPNSSMMHSRSHSTDSTYSLNGSRNGHLNSLDANQNELSQSQSNGLTPTSESIIDINDSPPPTPPIRYSSLPPENRHFSSACQALEFGHNHRPPKSNLVENSPQPLWPPQQHLSKLLEDNTNNVRSANVVDQLSSKQLVGLTAVQSPMFNYHVKQDSWPSFVSNTSSSSKSSNSSSSLKYNHRHTASQSAVLVNHDSQSTKSFYSNSRSDESSNATTLISQSPSLSSLIMSQPLSMSNGRHSIASCNLGANGYQQHSATQQIARSHRVQQVPRQESVCLPSSSVLTTKPPPSGKSTKSPVKPITFDLLETGGQNERAEQPLSPPPPLPPKNPHSHYANGGGGGTQSKENGLNPSVTSVTTSAAEIKAIQKRAVYEFYLRQKEKKERAKKCVETNGGGSFVNGNGIDDEIPNSVKPVNCDDDSSTCVNSTNMNSSNAESIPNDDLAVDDLPLPTPPLPILPPPNVSPSKSHNRFTFDHSSIVASNHEEQSLSLPLPSPPLPPFPPAATDSSVSESPFLSILPPPPSPLVQNTTDPIEKSPSLPPPPTPSQLNNDGKCSEFESFPLPPPPPSNVKESYLDTMALQQSSKQYLYFLKLWPLKDFSRLLSVMIQTYSSSCTSIGTSVPSQISEESMPVDVNPDDSEEGVDEELVQIEQCRKQKQLDLSRQSMLQVEQSRVEMDIKQNEKLGMALRDWLMEVNCSEHERNKLELLCNDMLRIIRLIISIVQQLSLLVVTMADGQCDASKSVEDSITSSTQMGIDATTTITTTTTAAAAAVKPKETHIGDSGGGVGGEFHSYSTDNSSQYLSQQKYHRLMDQLEAAIQLRNGIIIRKTMFEQRLCTKYGKVNMNMNENDSTKLAKDVASLIIDYSGDRYHHSPSSSSNGPQPPNNGTSTTTATDVSYQNKIDYDLTTVCRTYLERKEILFLHQELIAMFKNDNVRYNNNNNN